MFLEILNIILWLWGSKSKPYNNGLGIPRPSKIINILVGGIQKLANLIHTYSYKWFGDSVPQKPYKYAGLWPERLRNVLNIKVWAFKGNLVNIAVMGFHGFRNIINILVG